MFRYGVIKLLMLFIVIFSDGFGFLEMGGCLILKKNGVNFIVLLVLILVVSGLLFVIMCNGWVNDGWFSFNV